MYELRKEKCDSGFKSTVALLWLSQLFDFLNKVLLLSKYNLRCSDAIKLGYSGRNANNNSKNFTVV